MFLAEHVLSSSDITLATNRTKIEISPFLSHVVPFGARYLILV